MQWTFFTFFIWHSQIWLIFNFYKTGVWRSWWRQNNGHSSNSWRSAVIYDNKLIVLIHSNCLSTFDQYICWRDTFHALQTHEPMRMEKHEPIRTFISISNWFQQSSITVRWCIKKWLTNRIPPKWCTPLKIVCHHWNGRMFCPVFPCIDGKFILISTMSLSLLFLFFQCLTGKNGKNSSFSPFDFL